MLGIEECQSFDTDDHDIQRQVGKLVDGFILVDGPDRLPDHLLGEEWFPYHPEGPLDVVLDALCFFEV